MSSIRQVLSCRSSNETVESKSKRRAVARAKAGRSKTGTWGPTHSSDSEDTGAEKPSPPPNSRGDTDTTKEESKDDSAEAYARQNSTDSAKFSFERILETAAAAVGGFVEAGNRVVAASPEIRRVCSMPSMPTSPEPSWGMLLDDPCSPCRSGSPTIGHVLFSDNNSDAPPLSDEDALIKGASDRVSPNGSAVRQSKSHRVAFDNEDLLSSAPEQKSRGSLFRPKFAAIMRKLQNQSAAPTMTKNDAASPNSSAKRSGSPAGIRSPPSLQRSPSDSSSVVARRRKRHTEQRKRLEQAISNSATPRASPSALLSGAHGSNQNQVIQAIKEAGAPPNGTSPDKAYDLTSVLQKIPLETLTVRHDDAQELQRSISELTMKSSYGEATAKLAETRRMAYYAVGKHHGRGGNRRCYFSGKLILSGMPFYAGSVQQGLRTLVVFCLPSSIGLPKGAQAMMEKQQSSGRNIAKALDRTRSGLSHASSGSKAKRRGSAPTKMEGGGDASGGIKKTLNLNEASLQMVLRARSNVGMQRTRSGATGVSSAHMSHHTRTDSKSQLSSLGDDSYYTVFDDDLDPNCHLDRDWLLRNLPDPDQDLLDMMRDQYPEQFATLPVQVRSPNCWRLFVKFCFFSGLPVAEGELHYKVRDSVAMEAYGEEIILSHEVMEAVNGEQSAQILRLPNQKTFKYLRKHYVQQSGKLSDNVFQRKSWELVRPEV